MMGLVLLLAAAPALVGSDESAPPLKYLAPFNPDWQLAIELGHAVPTFQNLKCAAIPPLPGSTLLLRADPAAH